MKTFPFLSLMGAWVEDFRVANLLPRQDKPGEIVVVAVTEDTLKRFAYRSPIDRHFLSSVLQTLHAKGVRAIVLDFLLDQPTERAKDRELIRTLDEIGAQIPLVVAYAGSKEGLDAQQVEYLRAVIAPDLRGFANLAKDPFDGTVRTIFAGREEPGAGFLRGITPRMAEKLGFPVPADETPISWRGPAREGNRPFRTVPAHAVDIAPDRLFAGKIAFIGADLTLTDLHRTPFATGIGEREVREMPGVFIHAHALAQILDGRQFIRLGWWGNASLVFAFTLLAVGLSFLASSILVRITMVGCFVVALWVGCFVAFRWNLTILPLVIPTLSVIFSMWLSEIHFGRRQRLEKGLIRKSFAQYLSPQVVGQLIANPQALKLGGETRNMSVMFGDVRDFTAISEQFDAEGLTRLVTNLMTPLTDVIMDRNGTVDKYMGDCIMAFWNAPLDDAAHARNACLTALAMQDEMLRLNQRLSAEAENEGRAHTRLRIGIGINTGDVIVGNMGSRRRFDYTVLGDEVNLASRLEGLCKTHGVDVIIGENTQSAVAELATLDIDLIQVKGRKRATRIFALLGDESVAGDEGFQTLRASHHEMMAAYRGREWPMARSKLAECRALCGDLGLARVYDLYETRMERYETTPPAQDWDGVFVAQSK
ncbi:MAG: adenylate/guanylate cyclase domain-containing protein [Rhodospirillales bacterium]|nr:adenylate/guanylate cyclase domain-containing protein [Rhodospirillales bacterium]